MSIKCLYHPANPAHWHCPRCGSFFCPSCITVREMGGHYEGRKVYLCPNCMVESEWIGADNAVTPFWNRLPAFFTYPLAAAPLILILSLAVGSCLFAGAGLFNILVQFMIWGIMIKYAYIALKNTAQGDLKAPAFDFNEISSDFGQVFKQLGIYFVIGIGFVFTLQAAGLVTGIFFVIFMLLLVPSMIILLVATGSFFRAVNPVNFTSLALRIGPGYLIMYLFLAILALAPGAAVEYLMKLFPNKFMLFVNEAAKNYYTLVAYHLMGYVMLQYNRAVGYKVDFENFSVPVETGPNNASGSSDRQADLLGRINMLARDGKFDEAIQCVRDETDVEGIKDLTLAERYYTLLKLRKRYDEMASFGTVYIPLLVEENERKTGSDVYRECIAVDKNFDPGPDALLKVGGWLSERGDHRGAVSAINRMVKNYPDNPMVPVAYFRAAQIYYDGLMDREKAGKILKGVMSKYPNHDVTPKVQNYLQYIGVE